MDNATISDSSQSTGSYSWRTTCRTVGCAGSIHLRDHNQPPNDIPASQDLVQTNIRQCARIYQRCFQASHWVSNNWRGGRGVIRWVGSKSQNHTSYRQLIAQRERGTPCQQCEAAKSGSLCWARGSRRSTVKGYNGLKGNNGRRGFRQPEWQP